MRDGSERLRGGVAKVSEGRSDQAAVLEVKSLKTQFRTRSGIIRAVDDLSLELRPGETLGVVGESGCGKSVTALSILGLVPRPQGQVAGSIRLNGTELVGLSEAEYR